MKNCPTCEEPIPENQETCGDGICSGLLDNLIDPNYIREILCGLTEISFAEKTEENKN